MYVFTQSINGLSKHQKLMFPNELKTPLLCINFLMAYSKAKLKAMVMKETYKTNIYQSGLYYTFHLKTFLVIISYMGITNSMRTLDKTSLLTDLQAFFKPI
jgi:hypothetical protein